MPMTISDGDLMIAEEYLEKSGCFKQMDNPAHVGRARDVLAYALTAFKEQRGDLHNAVGILSSAIYHSR
jgi:hypothetical protein